VSSRTWKVREAGPADDEAVLALHFEYLTRASDQLAREYAVDFRPGVEPATVLEPFRRPQGRLLVAEHLGVPVATGAMRRVGTDVGEIKRMYVRPSLRGSGVGGAVLDGLLDAAAEMAIATVRLDTARFMAPAHALYRSRGFAERPPYAESEIPADLQQYWIFFERQVAVAARSQRVPR